MSLPRFRIRTLMIAVLAIALGLALARTVLRTYHDAIPAGAEFWPFWVASVKGPVLVSPDGQVVHVVFNDAGAAHSGNHWTWVIADDWTVGKRVIAQGFVDSGVRMGDAVFPLRWLDGRTFTVDFAPQRRIDADAPRRTVVVRLQ